MAFCHDFGMYFMCALVNGTKFSTFEDLFPNAHFSTPPLFTRSSVTRLSRVYSIMRKYLAAKQMHAIFETDAPTWYGLRRRTDWL